MPEQSIPVLINPLAFLEVDAPWAELRGNAVTLEHILKFACAPGTPRNLDAIISRYREVSQESPRLFAAPAEQRLLERLIWPLRHAKAAYMFGNMLGTLSLAGMVAEMAAIPIFDLSRMHVDGVKVDEQQERLLFGSTFEKLGQERRVDVLLAHRLIDGDLKRSFDRIRTARRRYLHLWSADHVELAKDAREAFQSAVSLVVAALGLNVVDGRLVLRPEVFAYLANHGVTPTHVDDHAS